MSLKISKPLEDIIIMTKSDFQEHKFLASGKGYEQFLKLGNSKEKRLFNTQNYFLLNF